MFQVLDWSFLVLHFDGNVCHWIPKVIWPWRGWFWVFLFKNGVFRWLHISTLLKSARIVVLLLFYLLFNCCSIRWHRIFSMFSLRGILVCSLKMLVPFNQSFFLISISKFWQSNATLLFIFPNFPFFVFSRKYWENSLVTSENQIVCFPRFVLIVFWSSTSYTVKNVLWEMLKGPVNGTACWWPCTCLKCVSGLRWLEKNLIFFEMHSCLWPGAGVCFRHKWRKLVTASLLLHCFDGCGWFR